VNSKGAPPLTASTFRLAASLLAAIFISEVAIMLLLDFVAPASRWTVAMLDATLLLAIIFPSLNIFVVRPLRDQVEGRRQAELERQGVLEQALKSDNRRRTAQRIAKVGYWENDLPSGQLWWDEETYRIFELDPTQDAPLSVAALLERVYPDDREKLWQQIESGLPYREDYRILLPEGGLKHIHEEVQMDRDADGRILKAYGTAQDITQRKQTEDDLRLLAEIAGSMAEGVYLVSATNLEIVYANPKMEAMFGYGPGEMMGRHVSIINAPSGGDPVKSAEEIEKSLQQTGDWRGEVLNARKDGTAFWGYATITRTRLSRHGDVYVSLQMDISERKEAERQRKIAEEESVRIFALTPALLCTVRPDGFFDNFNQAWTRVLGFTQEEILRAGYKALIHPDDLEPTETEIKRQLAGSATVIFTNRYRCKDGSYKTLEWNATPAVNGRLNACGIDVTERKRAEEEKQLLEEQLYHAEKMEAIGTLAGGVAHDFNNILCGLLGGLAVLELDLGEGSDTRRADIADMKAVVQRGADLTKQLLGFSRRGKYDPRPLDFGAVLRQTGTMFGRTRRDITIEYDSQQELQPVLMDHAQLEQVLLNLLLNAGQAMPDGGRLLLQTENATLTGVENTPSDGTPARFVKFVISDTGIGMDAATRARMFEPFFTTKPAGQGTGLGLASVYGIVKNHGGMIEVESEPGNGTAVTIFLPATKLPVMENAVPSATTRTSRGTILLVDDEELLLKTFDRLLTAAGFEILTASRGTDAIELVRVHRDRLSLVILDLTMPQASAAKIYGELREIAPQLKVLLWSGFAEEGQAQELMVRGCSGFVQKPFDITTLVAKIHSLI
jgi:PAS domain S-box-containing protein